MNLYLVYATDVDDYDTFNEGVVYAESANHAKEIVRDLCNPATPPAPEGTGSWMRIAGELRARRVRIRPGAVMGYSRAG